MNTSHDALHGHINKALRAETGTENSYDGPYVHTIFPTQMVYSHKGQNYRRGYSVEYGAAGSDPKVTLKGKATPVHASYSDSQATEALSVLLSLPVGAEENGEAIESIRGGVWDEILERFVSQDERKKAKPEDFAGKGTSFPILKSEDVAAALHSIGRGGADNYDAATLKRNILAIAKRKGFAVPASDKKGTESVYYTLQDGEQFVQESLSFEIPKALKEAASPAVILMKLIGPGWGSSAYYSKSVLQEAAKVFKAGTHMMWNHQTTAEENDRPEGDLHNLAAVLTENAKWLESGPKGPGLYSKAKVFSDYAKAVEEKGPHIGVSINAAIKCHEGTMDGRTGKIADQFVYAYSTDFVTKAGAGGAPVVPVHESLRVPIKEGDSNMTDQEVAALLESNKKLAESVTKLTESVDQMKADRVKESEESKRQSITKEAVHAVADKLRECGIVVKMRLIETACATPVLKEGKIDTTWVEGVAQDFAESFMGNGGVISGMGEGPTMSDDITKNTESFKEVMADLGVTEKGMEAAIRGGR
jgi:hypothetical protein